MPGQQSKELIVQGRETILLLKQLEDHDRAHRSVIDAQRNRYQRLATLARPASLFCRISDRDLSRLDTLPNETFTHLKRWAFRDVIAFDRDRRKNAGSLLTDIYAEDLGADQVDHDLENHLDDFARVQRRMELVTRHIKIGEVVVLFLDLDAALGEMQILAFDRAKLFEHRQVLILQLFDLAGEFLAQLSPLIVALCGMAMPLIDVVEFDAQPRILVEKLPGEVGSSITLDDVLMIGGNDDIKIGTPTVDGAQVTGTIVAQGRGPKIRVFKMKRRKGYRRSQGHRQDYTEIRVDEIRG